MINIKKAKKKKCVRTRSFVFRVSVSTINVCHKKVYWPTPSKRRIFFASKDIYEQTRRKYGYDGETCYLGWFIANYCDFMILNYSITEQNILSEIGMF